jgi:divalent metal cation (Fe/Co/Zn/Cd) transporter
VSRESYSSVAAPTKVYYTIFSDFRQRRLSGRNGLVFPLHKLALRCHRGRPRHGVTDKMSGEIANIRSQALALSYFTVGYNVLEGLISIAFAAAAGSAALLGFGIDSFVESLSGTVMIWRFAHRGGISSDEEAQRERVAIRLVGVSLMLAGGYVVIESVEMLYFGDGPDRHVAGLLIACVSLVVMPVLFVMKRRTAEALRSRSLAADAKQTLACILLSVTLLVGSGLHYTTGTWQADPISGLLIAGFLIREGHKAWREQDLCCC